MTFYAQATASRDIAGVSIMRAQNNSRNPMIISVISNFMNIGGNAILIFGFNMGVEGAAISTLVSRIFCAVVVIWQLRKESEPIFIKNYLSIRPEFSLIKKILFIGIGIGLMTVVGQCLGAGRKDESIYYIKKLSWVSEIVIIANCAL